MGNRWKDHHANVNPTHHHLSMSTDSMTMRTNPADLIAIDPGNVGNRPVLMPGFGKQFPVQVQHSVGEVSRCIRLGVGPVVD